MVWPELVSCVVHPQVVSDEDVPILGAVKFLVQVLAHTTVDSVQVPNVEGRVGVRTSEPA